MKKLTLLFLLACTGILELNAQIRKYSNEFLAVGVGGRAFGMAGASVAGVNDVTSGYWNPAGLMGIKNDFQTGLMHAEYFASIAKYDYGAVAGRIDSSSAFGISLIRFAVDDIANTTQLIDAGGNIDYDRITTFSAQDYAFIFSYARNLTIPGLSVGGNFKIIRRKVGDFAGAWGFGIDAGAQYKLREWQFGAVMRDVTSTFNAWSYTLSQEMIDAFTQTGNEIPKNGLELTMPRLILGVSRTWTFGKKEQFSAGGEFDLVNTFDGKRNVILRTPFWSMEPVVGFEGGFKNLIFLRAGIGNIQKAKNVLGKSVTTFQPNFGLGIKIKSVSIDYSLTDIGDQSVALYSNVFSLRLDLDRKK